MTVLTLRFERKTASEEGQTENSRQDEQALKDTSANASVGVCLTSVGTVLPYKTKYITCRKIPSPDSMHEMGCSGLVQWDDPEGWDGKGGGSRMGDTCTPVVDPCQRMAKLLQYCKVISL